MFMKSAVLAFAAFGALASAQSCPAPQGTVDFVGGSACACESGMYGPTCSNAQICTAMQTVDGLTINTGSSIPTTLTKLSADNTSIDISILIPMMDNRTYNPANIMVEQCGSSVALSSFATEASPAEACNDVWDLSIVIAKLEPCGFSLQDTVDPITSIRYQSYNGSITFTYQEYVLIAGDAAIADAQLRNVQVLLPILFEFQTSYTATFTTNDLQVYSTVYLDAALTGSEIEVGSTSSWAQLVYAVQFPYQVISMNPQVVRYTDASRTAPNPAFMLTQMYLDDKTSRVMDGTNLYDLPSCAGTANNTGSYVVGTMSTCLNTMQILWMHADFCVMDGYYSIVDVQFGCGVDISALDCPTQDTMPDGTINFYLTSENFCPNQGSNNIINGVVNITSFLAPPETQLLWTPTDGDTVQQNAWMWGGPLYMRMHLTGLNVTAVTLDTVSTKWDADVAYTLAGVGSYVDSGPTPVDTTVSLPGTYPANLGMDGATQAYLFMTPALDATFCTTAVVPARGAGISLGVQISFSVSYSLARRRRRQAAGDASGAATAALPPTTVTAPEAEASPSSAVRVAPAVALAIALVSAVALL